MEEWPASLQMPEPRVAVGGATGVEGEVTPTALEMEAGIWLTAEMSEPGAGERVSLLAVSSGLSSWRIRMSAARRMSASTTRPSAT